MKLLLTDFFWPKPSAGDDVNVAGDGDGDAEGDGETDGQLFSFVLLEIEAAQSFRSLIT